MLDRYITFGGDVIPAIIASTPKINRPARKIKSTAIPGSNREYVEMQEAWEPYDQDYELFVGDGSMDSIQAQLTAIAQILYKDGWQVLEDDYEPGIYRMAYFQGPFDVDNRYTRAGKFKITFRCQAERFLIEGNIPQAVASGGKVFNPTGFKSKPLIHITGSGNGTVMVNGVTMTFTGIADYLNIDCDTEDVYRLRAENRNNLMSGDFPFLAPGDNLVSFTGGIQSVTITPRFWTL